MILGSRTHFRANIDLGGALEGLVWVLGGTGYFGGDIFVADSRGSGILVVILVVVATLVVDCGGKWGCWRVVMGGGVCGWCWLVLMWSKN